jgi:hypothetical protein
MPLENTDIRGKRERWLASGNSSKERNYERGSHFTEKKVERGEAVSDRAGMTSMCCRRKRWRRRWRRRRRRGSAVFKDAKINLANQIRFCSENKLCGQ